MTVSPVVLTRSTPFDSQLPNTFLEPYPESNHPIAQWLVDNAKMDDLLARLLIADNFPDHIAISSGRAAEFKLPLINERFR